MARLAQEGMRFTDGYAPAPMCTPTRRSVLCGMTPARQHGTEFPSDFDPRKHLTLPNALKSVDARYRCAHFGKWGENMVAAPDEAGYDESDGITGNHTGDGETWEEKLQRQRSQQRLPGIAPEPLEDPKESFGVTRRAVDFMRRQADEKRPFYLQVSYYAVHDQIQARAETIDKYRKKGEPPRDCPPEFAAMLDDLDTCVGRVLDAIDDLGIGDNTYVFLASDNGGKPHRQSNPIYRNQLWREPLEASEATGPADVSDDLEDQRLPDNYPLRGAKQWLFEGGVRVPFVARGPGVRAGGLCGEPVSLYDLLPTLVDLAGGGVSLSDEIDGGSLKAPLLNGGAGAVKRAVPGLVFHRPFIRFRRGRILNGGGMSALRSGDLKLVVDLLSGEKALFDVRHDPGETNDLSDERPEDTERLSRILTDYLEAVGAEKLQAQKATAGLKESRDISEERKAQIDKFAEQAFSGKLERMK